MSKEIEDKLVKIPVLNVLLRFGKKIKIPGLEGMSLYDVLEMYIIGIVEGALTTRAGGIAYSFFMAIFPFMLFVLTLIPYIHIDGFQEGLMTLISEVLPPKTFDAVDTVLLDILGNKQAGLLSFGFLGSIFLMTNGVNAIFGGFEYSYHVKENRNVFRAYFLSMFVSLLMALFLVITVALTGFYQLVLDAFMNKGWIDDETIWLQFGRGGLFLIMIFTIVSIIALFGTFFKLFYTGRFEKLSLVLYLFMGWLVILDIKTVFEVIEFNGFLLLVLGGVSYSIGTIFYSLDKKYAHTVWHLFVLAGSTLHFFFILFYII